ncbi:hypothetical protein [Paragemmobacter straminiformis]|uniref:Uncharacterized protein n=1 Tax=Paragemmobacter straminiformis TaxID=2045119 RepID=A0A842IAS4_9RHOB|nr:hypothetical protein [Gemmobacter straminiformis]MBC2836088.1 hypothetical protein [Gemmobacter straminiformis]
MTTELSSSARLRLVLVSTGPSAALAAATLQQHLNLPERVALERLSSAPSVLAEGLDADTARRLANLLRSFGLRVRVDGDGVTSDLVDLSIQLAMPLRVQRTVRQIVVETGLDAGEIGAALAGPGGLVLTGLPRDEVSRLQQSLGRMNSLTLIESDPASAVYDVYLPDGTVNEALSERLRMMGAEGDPITGAVATGLDRALCRHLVQRFPDAGLIAIDRAFQRFDLYLTRVTGWVTRDLADFLAARTGLPRSRFEVLSQGTPLRIELGLTHAAARQFRADYATIGLHTLMVLSGLGEDSDNSIA